jgi:uncharacterized Zn-finger protein
MTDKTQKEIFDTVVNYVDKNERIAWKRRHKNFGERIIRDVTPLEEQILELTMQKMHIMDTMEEDRQELIKSCVHPREFLVLKDDGYVLCKFCQSKLRVSIENED